MSLFGKRPYRLWVFKDKLKDLNGLRGSPEGMSDPYLEGAKLKVKIGEKQTINRRKGEAGMS